jgi:hypothetical protein
LKNTTMISAWNAGLICSAIHLHPFLIPAGRYALGSRIWLPNRNTSRIWGEPRFA